MSTVVHLRLGGLLATADRPYAQLMAYVRCRLSFALLRAAIMCIRKSRSAYHRPVNAMRESATVKSGFYSPFQKGGVWRLTV